MRDDTSDPRDTRDPNHIWLRQSVTFAVNGQTRTLEMALPLRPGATPEEVDALLDEADAGMRRLSRRLDAHLAEVTGAAPAEAVIAPAPPAPAAAERAPSPGPAPQPAPTAPQPTSAERPAPRPAAAAAQPAPSATAAPQPPRATAPAAPATPASGGPDLTRAEFLTATGALGLDARSVMERLNVRSLNGLNLREALDLLRRQLVREGGESAPALAEEAAPTTPDEAPAPIGSPRFDEEDDGPEFELSYPNPEELPSDDDFAGEDEFAPLEEAPSTPAPVVARAATPSGPLGDVPDLDDLLGASAAPAAPATPTAPAEPAADPTTTRAREVIATLRAAHAGGQPVPHQRNAYKNLVIDQLGETKAAGVARAVWNLTPERLGPEQLDALIRWGKEDAFVEEVEAVLDMLRAEYIAAQQAQQAQQANAPATPTRRAAQRPAQAQNQPAAPEPAARPAPRGRPASPRAARDGSQGGA